MAPGDEAAPDALVVDPRAAAELELARALRAAAPTMPIICLSSAPSSVRPIRSETRRRFARQVVA
jgi:hypothetical protein